ncbi:putative DNA methylase [Methanosarcina sp. MTP4]|uniref:site-specific DNA-methyltransferase n=1 Tax=Methanosarcina sp. MTP4 TaxID=1434100 RepID=UPI0006157B4E|nr:site-specific DNA-methyltransferase [Methanosarcina sp. MTP4]AKB24957.1 putative DNA methylase [Methanosarcina sp. MTP4]
MAKAEEKSIEQYDHLGKERANNPPVGLVTPKTDPDTGEMKKYEYDPHLDPQLQWAGKTEHTSFDVPTVSLHVHERIDPKTIVESAKKGKKLVQASLFDVYDRPLREAIEFYKHKEGWTNRLIAGDSLLVMNSLLEKEGMGGQVQTIYIDPPYGIKYGSNFQPFVNKRDVKDGKDEDLTSEPEMIKAFRDTWELGIHSYLTYMRDRLLLARELLHESGSVFVQISDENVHHVRELMDEVFGLNNFVGQIAFQKTGGFSTNYIPSKADYIIWYSKDKLKVKYRPLFIDMPEPPYDDPNYVWIELENGSIRRMTPEERRREQPIPKKARIFRHGPLQSDGKSKSPQEFKFEGDIFVPNPNCHWKTTVEGLNRLASANKILRSGKNIAYKLYWDNFPVRKLDNIWLDTQSGGFNDPKIYVVQTTNKTIQRCLLMSTDPGDLVLDITCGSGTTAYVAEQWGRRWITCDTSRVALTLAKQRLMIANFDYYQLAHPDEGVGSGFLYKTVPHITLKSIANNETAQEETLYDLPLIDKKKNRVTGPFTVEAVPSLTAKSLEEIEQENSGFGVSISRSGETLRQEEWRDELLRTGIRAKSGNMIKFSRVEPLSGTRYIQAEGETKEGKPKKVLIVFGPEHAPLEQRTVENAWQEARALEPDILLFCAFQFEEEAAKDIDEMNPEIAGMYLLKAQMNSDLFTEDLKKKRSGNESFWLIGQPEVKLRYISEGEEAGKYEVEVLGFDYYNPKTGDVESGGKGNISMWMLDTDYDERSLFPSQVFLPMAGAKDGWAKLAKNLKAEVDTEKLEKFRDTVSIPFEKGRNGKIAVKIIDDRGIESLRVLKL